MTRDELRAWRNSKIDRVMLTSDAVNELAYLDYGRGLEAAGGIYGEVLNGAFLVRQFEDFSREATAHDVAVDWNDMAARHRPDIGLSWLGHWHTHESWEESVSPSPADRIAWRSMTCKFGDVFLAMIGGPTSPGGEVTGPLWSRGGDWFAWGCEEIDGKVRITELPVRRTKD